MGKEQGALHSRGSKVSAARVVVDANIAFRAIVARRGDLRAVLRPPTDVEFVSPRFVYAELFKHKERLLRATGWGNETLSRAVHLLML